MAKGPPALPFAHAHPAVIDEPPALHRPRGRLPAGGRLGLLGRRAQRPRAPRVALALVDADPLYVCARIGRARVRHPATLRRPDRHTHSRPSTSHGASTRRSSRAARTSPPRPPTSTPPPGVPPPPTLGRRAAVGAAARAGSPTAACRPRQHHHPGPDVAREHLKSKQALLLGRCYGPDTCYGRPPLSALLKPRLQPAADQQDRGPRS